MKKCQTIGELRLGNWGVKKFIKEFPDKNWNPSTSILRHPSTSVTKTRKQEMWNAFPAVVDREPCVYLVIYLR